MSRIGKKPIPVPSAVEITVAESRVSVKGPKGTLTRELHPHVQAVVATAESGRTVEITVTNPDDPKDRALWGLTRALVANMALGVVTGYSKKLEINGVGFRANVAGQTLNLELGFSYPVAYPLPSGITATVEKNIITLSGIDKELLGETAARIRRLRPVEPYKGKGIKYVGEYVRRKAGKAAKAGAAAK